MSITPQTNITKLIKGYDVLEKHFDIVEFDTSNEKYNVLTCKDRVVKHNTNILYEVWLCLPIRKNYDNQDRHSSHSDKEYVEGCIERLLQWIDILKVKETPHEQLSLFDDPNEIVLELEPVSPNGGDDRKWNGYFKKLEGVKRRNLMKQYDFIELFNFHAFWRYSDSNYYSKLPSIPELEQLIKNAILKYKNNPGRHEDAWFEINPCDFKDCGPISDYDLYSWIMNSLRLFLVPYIDYEHLSIDMSYTVRKIETCNRHRFYYDRGKISSSCSWDENGQEIDFFTPEFISWLRETFKVEYTEHIEDEEAIKYMVQDFFDRNSDFNISTDSKFNSLKDFKKYFKSLFKDTEENYYYNCSFTIDDYSSYVIFKNNKSSITIDQISKTRRLLKKDFIQDTYRTVICTLEGLDEILEKAYELFNKPSSEQLTLF